jgi:hypothetical protein
MMCLWDKFLATNDGKCCNMWKWTQWRLC